MACGCKNKTAKRETYQVVLPGGTKITKTSEAAAVAFAAKHPGSTYSKSA